MIDRVRAVLGIALVAAGVSGCGSAADDEPRQQLPPITRPLDASAYATQAKICQLFTDQDAQAYGYSDQGQDTESTPSSPACVWSRPTFLDVAILNTDFLRDFYGTKGTAFVEGITVAGQPGAKLVGDPAGRAPVDEHCRILVALDDEQSLDVIADLGHGAHGACDRAVLIATRVLDKLGA